MRGPRIGTWDEDCGEGKEGERGTYHEVDALDDLTLPRRQVESRAGFREDIDVVAVYELDPSCAHTTLNVVTELFRVHVVQELLATVNDRDFPILSTKYIRTARRVADVRTHWVRVEDLARQF